MKTTLMIDDDVMKELKALAAREGTTISVLVESSLRRILADSELSGKDRKRIELPLLDGGRPLVDIADREALYRAMESERS